MSPKPTLVLGFSNGASLKVEPTHSIEIDNTVYIQGHTIMSAVAQDFGNKIMVWGSRGSSFLKQENISPLLMLSKVNRIHSRKEDWNSGPILSISFSIEMNLEYMGKILDVAGLGALSGRQTIDITFRPATSSLPIPRSVDDTTIRLRVYE
ncbi:MAG: hypothetical protein ACKVRP_09405 [Bacteroidota bacterium]